MIAHYQRGEVSAIELSELILAKSFITEGGVTADVDRERRTGFPEVIYGEGKPIDALIAGCDRVLATQPREILVTRVNVEQARALGERYAYVRWNCRARTIRIGLNVQPSSWELPGCEDVTHCEVDSPGESSVAVISAGTTDAPVAEEALETLAWMGVRASWHADLGVAGPHRIISRLPMLRASAAIVAIAGMEGALPSMLAGFVGVPIFAVPTSVGYGANFQGLAALLTMLNSCASNVAVVNIDAGFRGGYLAGLVASNRTNRVCD